MDNADWCRKIASKNWKGKGTKNPAGRLPKRVSDSELLYILQKKGSGPAGSQVWGKGGEGTWRRNYCGGGFRATGRKNYSWNNYKK